MAFNDPNYQGPSKDGQYLNFKETGKHQFRFMSNVETYKRFWKDKRPYRFTDRSEVPKDVDLSTFNGKPQIEEVWAVIAIAKDEKGKPVQIGILPISQKTIQSSLMSLYQDEDYGDFTGYDIVIERTDDKPPKYQVTPKPPKAVSKDELEMYENFPQKDLSKIDAPDDPSRKMFEDVDAKDIPF